MNANGFICFTAGTEKLAKGNMSINGVAINIQCMDKGVNRFVGLLVQQIVQPDEVFP